MTDHRASDPSAGDSHVGASTIHGQGSKTTPPDVAGQVGLAQDLAGRRGLTDVEVYAKRGRSRLFDLEQRPEGDRVVVVAQQVRDRWEQGWAMRYGGKRGWGFTTGSGAPPSDPPLTKPHSGRLLLPQTPGPRRPEPELEPLISETRAQRGIGGLSEALPPVAIGRRLKLQDGQATSGLANNHGLAVDWWHRTGLVSLEEWLPGGAVLRLHAVAQDAATALAEAVERWPQVVAQAQRVRWVPPPAARRQVEEESLATAGGAEPASEARPASPDADRSRRSSLVLAPEAAASLVSTALHGWSAEARDDGVASPVVQICDAPDWPAGPMSSPVDGQGQPLTRRTVVHDGRLVAILADAEATVVRRGWRDLPSPGYQQPVVLPGSAGVEELIAGIEDGWWLPARVEVPVTVSGPHPLVFLGRPIRHGRIQSGAQPQLVSLDVRPGDFCQSIRELADEICFQPARSGILGLPAVRAEGVRVKEC